MAMVSFLLPDIVIERMGQGLQLINSDNKRYCNLEGVCVMASDRKRAEDFIKVVEYCNKLIKSLPVGHQYRVNLEKRFKSSRIQENFKTFVRNKGDVFALCHGDVDINTLKFVATHELSHLAMTKYDTSHSEDFWFTFKSILAVAYDNKLLDIVDYNRTPVNYCGIVINHNPYL